MVLSVGLVLLLAVTSTQAPRCRENQECSDCDNKGVCTTECNTGYFDLSCKSKCNKACKNDRCKATETGIGECTDGCIHGYLGINCNIKCKSYYDLSETYCLEVCSQHCKFVSSTNHTIRCLTNGASASAFCTSECHMESGECLHGCVDSWYGLRCSFPCSAGCSGGRCDAVGDCVDGCRSGYFGRDCESCDRCKNRTCGIHNGTCVEGCRPGYFGELCKDSCEVCRDGICDQKTGACVNGCDVSEGACERSCTSNCSMDYCLHAPTCDADSKVNVINIGLPAGCAVFLLALLAANYICYRKGYAARREIHAPDEEQAPSDDYQFYCEIEEAHMGVDPQIQPVSHNNCEEELDMPVIAEVFPAAPAIVPIDGDTSSESPASSTSRSYTHLIPDVVTDDLTPGDAYLSPVEDAVLYRQNDLTPGDAYLSRVEDGVLPPE